MNNYEDVTAKYATYPRVDISQLALGSKLMIGDLIQTPDGRILIPEMGPDEANLFAIYGNVDETPVLIAEFPTLGEAETFLDRVEEQGYQPLRWADVLSPLKRALKEALFPVGRPEPPR